LLHPCLANSCAFTEKESMSKNNSLNVVFGRAFFVILVSQIYFYKYCYNSVVFNSSDDRLVPPTGSYEDNNTFDDVITPEINFVDDMLWDKLISDQKAHYDIELFTRKIPSSKLLAFKGTSVVNTHISNLLAVFLNNTLTAKHLTFVSKIIEFPMEENGQPELLYTYYNLPWPLRRRDSLLAKNIQINQHLHTVVATYDSITDERMPLEDKCIRTESITHWNFHILGNDTHPQTLMTFEATVDLKGKIPAWFINYIQKSHLLYLLKSLTVTAEAYTGSPYEAISQW
jgi:hypothetical protein